MDDRAFRGAPLRARSLDLALAAVLLAPAALLCAAIALAVLLADGRPVLHRSDRVTTGGRIFTLLKFRTMRPDPAEGGGEGVTGGHKASRVTPLGRFLRRSHLDELPQILNILRGDMGFVGPRPPLPSVVARHPQVYARVLAERPGLTGLASLVFRTREAALLSDVSSQASAEEVYARRCLPAKARLDGLRRARPGLALDLLILAGTVSGRSSLPFRRFCRRLSHRRVRLNPIAGKSVNIHGTGR
ncbi:MAG: sugar transferase [Rhodobacteraceae bacterium]|nr:sugar transferase [Paracoccaceae bacterium]